MEMILASASPRRKEILLKAGYDFKVIPSKYDEKISNKKYSSSLVENCALNKAKEIYNNHNNSLIIASDTVVVVDDIILGKPKNRCEAINMLLNLSDKEHFVATSICIIYKNKILCDTQKTYVTFRKLDLEDIEKYIDTKKPYDKAGSYGIQDDGFDFAIKIKGDLDNVIGFPVKLFEKMLNKIKN